MDNGQGGPQAETQVKGGAGLWSDTMSQVEETLGGLRIIKHSVLRRR